jgi:hypothetical protein
MKLYVVTKDVELPSSLGNKIGTGSNKSRFISDSLSCYPAPHIHFHVWKIMQNEFTSIWNTEHNHVLYKLLMEILTIYLRCE